MAKEQPNLGRFSGVQGSIQNLITTEIFDTEFSSVDISDLQDINLTNGWALEWTDFLSVYNLVKVYTINNPNIIQGLVTFRSGKDHIFMEFVEVAPYNRGQNKTYDLVAGNLIAFLCYLSQRKGFGGWLFFQSKPQLVSYYQAKYYAQEHPKRKEVMYIAPKEAQILIDIYLT
jgi:hypothetical protein